MSVDAVTGITGQVGFARSPRRSLPRAREVLRRGALTKQKVGPGPTKGCEVAIASIGDADAFNGRLAGHADGVFLMTPPNFDPEPGFHADAGRLPIAIEKAIVAARPGKVVFLSTRSARKSLNPISLTTRR